VSLATAWAGRDGRYAAPAMLAAIVAVLLAAILSSHISIALFVVGEGLLVALGALASLRWPRAALVAVVLSPILDRYIVPGLLAPEAEPLAHFLSEALLAAIGATLLVQSARRGTLRAALNHPAIGLAAAFVAVAAVSALVNGVPAAQAVAGIAFTVDALALFVLARVVGFGSRQSLVAIGVVIGLVLAAAVVALGQALLTPYLFGLSALPGRFGELYRLGAFFGDPNTLAAFLSATIPFALFGATGLRTQRGRRVALAAGFLLVLALWLSFSRGGWLGAVGGFAIAALILDRRTLRLGLLVMVIGLVVAVAMPRNLACATCADELDLFGSTFGRFDTIGQGNDLRTLFIRNALPIVADHPVLGVGPGRYGGAAADIFRTPIYAQYGTDRLFVDPAQRTVDDFWLHLWVESGTLGLLLFLGTIGAALRPVMRAARTAAWGRRVALAGLSAAVIGLSINGLTTMLLEANSAAFLFWFLLGIGSQLTVAPDDEGPARTAVAVPA
jgi:putative inorganic carbon (HCO3(-)) transporter